MPARIWIESHDSRTLSDSALCLFCPNTHLREFCHDFDLICMMHFEFSVRAVFSNLFEIVFCFFVFVFWFNSDSCAQMETTGGKDALVAYTCQVLDLALSFFTKDGVTYQIGKGACG